MRDDATGSAPDGNAIPIGKEDADLAMDAAAALLVSPKISDLGRLPRGKVKRTRRALARLQAMNIEGFANCTNISEREAACPNEIKLEVIARTNRDYIKTAPSWSTPNPQLALAKASAAGAAETLFISSRIISTELSIESRP